jgi:hypothetical protein
MHLIRRVGFVKPHPKHKQEIPFFDGMEGEIDLLDTGLDINLLQIFHFFGKRMS